MTYLFEVKTLEAGQRGRYQDSFYTYEVTSDRHMAVVRAFCMKVLRPSYEKKDMPNPFAGELLEFTQITTNNKNSERSIFDKEEPETYLYRVKNLYTD